MPSVNGWQLQAQYDSGPLMQAWHYRDGDDRVLLSLNIKTGGVATVYAFEEGKAEAVAEDQIPIGHLTEDGLKDFALEWRNDVVTHPKSRNYWSSALAMPPGAFRRWWNDELNTKQREEAPAEIWNRVQMIDKSVIRPIQVHPNTKEMQAEIKAYEYPVEIDEGPACTVCGRTDPHGPHDLVGATIEGEKVMSAKVDGVEDKMTLGFHLEVIGTLLSAGAQILVKGEKVNSRLELNDADITESVKAMYEKLTVKPTMVDPDAPTEERYISGFARDPANRPSEDQLPWHVQWTATLDSFVQQMRGRAHRMGLEQTALREQWANLEAEREQFAGTQKRWYGVVEDELGTLATPAELAAAILRLAQPPKE